MDLLFEPLRVGPNTSRNRLWRLPVSGAEVPTAGDWGAVFLGETFIVPGAKLLYPTINLFDDEEEIQETVHGIRSSGALAGVEFAYNPIGWETIPAIVERYAEAAEVADRAGFSLISLYVAHGGGEFLKDKYTAERVIEAIRAGAPEASIGMRTSDFEGVRALDPLIDYWDIVAPGVFPDVFRPSPIGTKVQTHKPVVHSGFVTPETMREALFCGHCDIVGLARPALADPALPTKLLANIGIHECTHCQGCVDLYMHNEPVVCVER